MTKFKFASVGTWALGMGAALVLLATPALSRPSASPVSDELLLRVLILEERVHFLQRQVDQLKHGQITSDLEKSGWLKDDTAGPDCSNPYIDDKSPILKLRPECVKAGSERCVPPYAVSADGIKRINGSCVSTLSESDCDPPYSVDANGFKHYRPECLEAR